MGYRFYDYTCIQCRAMKQSVNKNQIKCLKCQIEEDNQKIKKSILEKIKMKFSAKIV